VTRRSPDRSARFGSFAEGRHLTALFTGATAFIRSPILDQRHRTFGPLVTAHRRVPRSSSTVRQSSLYNPRIFISIGNNT